MHTGTITSIVQGRGFGFIRRPGEPDTFFHCTELRDGLEFNEQLIEREVTFEVVHRESKQRAVNVRAANSPTPRGYTNG